MRFAATMAVCALFFACQSASVPPSPNDGQSCAACVYIDPWQAGPSPVGVRSELWIDHDRDALAWTGCGYSPCPRPVPISIWYPAVDGIDHLPPSSFEAFFSVTEAELQVVVDDLIDELGGDRVTITIPDTAFLARQGADIRPGRWPVVVFSHGAGGVRFQSVFLTEYLAGHGYIVVAPDHEGDATITEIDGEIVTVDTRQFVESAFRRPRDVQFVIDTLTRLDADPAHVLYGKVAVELGVGLTGHSFGSFTSITVASIDPRIAAIVPMAAPGISGFGENVPTMFMVATEDDTIDEVGNAAIRWQFEIAQEPKLMVEFLDAGHFTFSNMCDLFPDFGDGCGEGERIASREPLTYVDDELAFKPINGFTTAWFGLYIKGASGYGEALQQDPYAKSVRYDVSGNRLR